MLEFAGQFGALQAQLLQLTDQAAVVLEAVKALEAQRLSEEAEQKAVQVQVRASTSYRYLCLFVTLVLEQQGLVKLCFTMNNVKRRLGTGFARRLSLPQHHTWSTDSTGDRDSPAV